MAEQETSKRLRLALMAGACGMLLCLSGAVAAYAGDDAEEDTFEQKIIKNILGGMGVDVGRPSIEYRERSPLVVPPTRDLPPPEAAVRDHNPAWPKEQKKKQVAAKQNLRASPEEPGTSSALTAAEMRATAKPSSKITDRSQSGSEEEPLVGRPMTPTELNTKSNFGWGMLFGYKPEHAPFEGEPSRSALTQPPPGYQTQSPAAPYGIGEDRPSGWKIPTVLSRPEGSPDN